MNRFYAALALSSVLALSQQAIAQDNGAATVSGENSSGQHVTAPHGGISLEEREARRAALRQKFKSMTPEEKQQFLTEIRAKMQKHYDTASPEQKIKIKERMDKLDARLKNPGLENEPGQ